MPRFSILGLTAVAAGCLALAAGIAPAAATYSVIHSFSGGVDGNGPQGALLQDSGGNIIGTTQLGGTLGLGNIYGVSADGSIFNNIYSFGAGIDGQVPTGGLRNGLGDIQSAGPDFGVAQAGGNAGLGTVFTSDLAGHEVTLYNFQGLADGSTPTGRLLYWPSQRMWYGTALSGGTNESGTVFRIAPNGTGFSVRHGFKGSDGAGPLDGLQYGGDGNFYGLTTGGGLYGNGVLYRVTPGNGGFKVIRSFTGGADGAIPEGVLGSDCNGNLYGITNQGGLYGFGTIFRVLVSGQHFTTLYNFTGGSDGANPGASVTLVGPGGCNSTASLSQSTFSSGSPSGTLYGTTTTDGDGLNGTVWSFNLNTNTFSVLYAFTGGLDGGTPLGKLLVSTDGNIYGTTNGGGMGFGVVFKIGGALSNHSVRRAFQGFRTIH